MCRTRRKLVKETQFTPIIFQLESERMWWVKEAQVTFNMFHLESERMCWNVVKCVGICWNVLERGGMC